MSVLSFLTDTASSAVLSSSEQSSITTSITTLQSSMALHLAMRPAHHACCALGLV